MKKILKEVKVFKTIIIFLTLLLGFTMISNFIDYYTQPVVKFAETYSSRLKIKLEADSKIESDKKEVIFSKNKGKIKNIFIKENDYINEGEVLYSYDIDSLNNTLEELKNKKAIQGQEVANSVKTYENYVNIEMPSKTSEKKGEISKLKEDYEIAKKLFNEGAISKKELKDKKRLYEKENSSLELFTKELNQQKNQYEYTNLKNVKTLEKIVKSIKGIKKSIENDGKVLASFNGKIDKLLIELGNNVSIGDSLIVLEKPSDLMISSFNLDSDKAKYLSVNDKVDLSYPSLNSKIIGTIKRIENHPTLKETKKISISYLSEYVETGNNISLNHIHNTRLYDKVVPKESISKNEEGYFIWVVYKEKSGFGDQYKVNKKYIEIIDKGDRSYAIKGNLTGEEKIVMKVINNKFLKENKNVNLNIE